MVDGLVHGRAPKHGADSQRLLYVGLGPRQGTVSSLLHVAALCSAKEAPVRLKTRCALQGFCVWVVLKGFGIQ